MQNSDPRRVAVLTGAGGALGFHFACRLAKEGYRLALADLQMPEDTATAARELGADVYSESFDLADAQAVQAFGCHVLERFGRCDILVNNAAFMPLIPFEALTLDIFRRFQAVNVEASFLLAQHFAKDMASRDHLQAHRGGHLSETGVTGRPLRRLGRQRGARLDLGKDRGT